MEEEEDEEDEENEAEKEQPHNPNQRQAMAAFHHSSLVDTRWSCPRGPSSLFRMWGTFVLSMHPCDP